MIGYVMVGTNNLDAAIKFYDEVLEVIGLTRNETVESDVIAGYRTLLRYWGNNMMSFKNDKNWGDYSESLDTIFKKEFYYMEEAGRKWKKLR